MGLRKKAILWMGLGVLAIALAACGGGAEKGGTATPEQGNGQVEPAVPQQPTTPSKPSEPVEIVFYSQTTNMNEEGFDQKYGEMIKKKFPDYTIQFIPRGTGTTLPELLVAGAKIDIYFGSIGVFEEAMINNDLQVDMSELIRKHNVNLDTIEPTIITAVRQASGGNLYGLPVEMNTLVLHYNKALFNKFGVPLPKDDMTWDEVSELANRLTRVEDGVQYYGYSTSNPHNIRMNSLSLDVADLKTDTPTINTNESWRLIFNDMLLKPVAGYIDQFREKKLNNPPSHTNNYLRDQNLAMYAYMLTLLSSYPDQLKQMDSDMVSLPTFKEKPGVGAQVSPTYFGLTKRTRHADAAMEVLKYMVSEEYQKELGRRGMLTILRDPAVRDVFLKENEFNYMNLAAIYRNPFAPISQKAYYDAQLVTVYHNAILNGVLKEGKDLNTALREAEEEAKKTIAEFKSK